MSAGVIERDNILFGYVLILGGMCKLKKGKLEEGLGQQFLCQLRGKTGNKGKD